MIFSSDCGLAGTGSPFASEVCLKGFLLTFAVLELRRDDTGDWGLGVASPFASDICSERSPLTFPVLELVRDNSCSARVASLLETGSLLGELKIRLRFFGSDSVGVAGCDLFSTLIGVNAPILTDWTDAWKTLHWRSKDRGCTGRWMPVC